MVIRNKFTKTTMFAAIFLSIVMTSGFTYLYRCTTVKSHDLILKRLLTIEHDSKEIEYPSVAFFLNLAKYYKWMEQLQAYIDTAAKSRQGVIGNIAWHPTQIYYYARSASFQWVSNICEVGYGAGHSTLLYLAINPKARVYSFDLFPNNKDDKVHTPGETLVYQQAFQAVTLKAIEENKQLSSRFHKIVGNSNFTIPNFTRQNPRLRCDVISIDGSHNPPQPLLDILHCQSMAHQQTVVLLDDMHILEMKDQMTKSIEMGILSEYECLEAESRVDERFASVEQIKKQFCVARYRTNA